MYSGLLVTTVVLEVSACILVSQHLLFPRRNYLPTESMMSVVTVEAGS